MTQETLMTEAATTTEGNQASEGGANTAEVAQSAAPTEQAPQEQQAVESQNPTEGKAEEASDKQEKPVVPEKYEFKNPEGAELSAEVLEAFSAVSKDLALTQDAAQKILDKMSPVMAARQLEVFETAKAQWVDSTRGDKEIGGDKLQENLAVAGKALEAFGTPELRGLLNESGLGNHPEVIRMFYRAGKAISEDGFVKGGRASAAQSDPAKRLFPNQA